MFQQNVTSLDLRVRPYNSTGNGYDPNLLAPKNQKVLEK